MELFGAKCDIVRLVMKGIQQRKNAKTITMAILSTFRFFLDRCSLCVGWRFTRMGVLLKLDQDDSVKHGQQNKGNVKKCNEIS